MALDDKPTEAQLGYIADLREQTGVDSEVDPETRAAATAEITHLRNLQNEQRREARLAAEKGREGRERAAIARDAETGFVNASGFRDEETVRDQGGRYSDAGFGGYDPEPVSERQATYLKALCKTHGVEYAAPGSVGAATEMIDQLQERTDQEKFRRQFVELGPQSRAAVMDVLSDVEAKVLDGLYVRGLTPNQVAGELKIAKRSVDLRDTIARDKVRRVLSGDLIERAKARSQQQSL